MFLFLLFLCRRRFVVFALSRKEFLPEMRQIWAFVYVMEVLLRKWFVFANFVLHKYEYDVLFAFSSIFTVTLVGRKRWRLKPWAINFFLYLYRGNINSALKAPKCFMSKESFPNINFSQDGGKIDFYFGQAPLPVCETSSRTFCRTPPTWDKYFHRGTTNLFLLI